PRRVAVGGAAHLRHAAQGLPVLPRTGAAAGRNRPPRQPREGQHPRPAADPDPPPHRPGGGRRHGHRPAPGGGIVSTRVPPPGPVPPSAGAYGPPTGTVPDAPRAILRLAHGTVIDGTVIGRDAAGRTTVKTGVGLLPLAVNPPLPVGSRLSLE